MSVTTIEQRYFAAVRILVDVRPLVKIRYPAFTSAIDRVLDDCSSHHPTTFALLEVADPLPDSPQL